MKRRTFLAGLVTTAATLGSVAACVDVGEVSADALGEPSLLPALGADAVRALGRQYLAKTPGETDATTINAALRADLKTLRGLPWNPVPDFQSLVRADFDAERTVWLDGWLLSRNEGRRLALFALSAPS
jgi:hypothetical protein